MISIRVVPDNGDSYEVTVTARDILKWERMGGGRSVGLLEAGVKLSHIYELAHIASQRTKQFTGSLEAFEETCDLTFQEVEDGEDFTQRAPSTEPASNSQSSQVSPRRNGQTKGRKR